MNIYLIRHGETEANLVVNASPVLTEKGMKQINALAKRLKDIKIDAIVSSNQERALLTAKEIQKHNPVELVVTEELQEIYRLIIGGKPKEGTRPNRFEEDKARAEDYWKNMSEWTYENVAVVCHGNIIKFLLSKAMDAPLNYFNTARIDPASISIINLGKDKSKISVVNDTAHLSEELLTKDSIYVE